MNYMPNLAEIPKVSPIEEDAPKDKEAKEIQPESSEVDSSQSEREAKEWHRAVEALEVQLKLMEKNQQAMTKQLSSEVRKIQKERLQEDPLYKAYQSCIHALKSLAEIGKDFTAKTAELAVKAGKIGWEIGKAGMISGAAGAASWEFWTLLEEGGTTGNFTQDSSKKITAAGLAAACALVNWFVYKLEQNEQNRTKHKKHKPASRARHNIKSA